MTNHKTLFAGFAVAVAITAAVCPAFAGDSVLSALQTQYAKRSVYTLSSSKLMTQIRSLDLSSGLADIIKDSSSKDLVYNLLADEFVSSALGDFDTPDTKLTINGNGNGINGNGVKGVKVYDTNTLVVNNVGSLNADGTVKTSWNGFDRNSGGTINNLGTLVVNNSVFTNNIAKDDNYSGGGAIYNENKADIKGSTFIDNKSSNGGAIFNDGNGYGGFEAVMTISDSKFVSNSADQGNKISGGGAIFNSGKMDVTKSVFENNYSKKDGGAIYSEQAKETSGLTVSDSEFTCNIADANGGAIGVYGGSALIENSTFKNNRSAENGGALFSNVSDLTVKNSTFSGNGFDDESGTTTRNGGAIYIYTGNANISGSKIIGNKSSAKGGGVYVGGNSVITDTLVSGNISRQGGGIYTTSATGEVAALNTIKVNKNVAEDGAGIFITGDALINQAEISENNASSRGGALYIDYAARATVNNSVIKGNISTQDGGAFYVNNEGFSDWENDYFSGLYVNNTEASGNQAVNGGALYAASQSTATFVNSVFSGNNATNGGAIYNNSGTVTLKNTSIYNNGASDLGGGIYNDGIIYILADKGLSEISGNTASGESSGIYMQNGEINLDVINGGTIRINDKVSSADADFGGIIKVNNTYMDQFDGPIEDISGTVIFNNTVSDSTIELAYGTLKFGEYGNTHLADGAKYLDYVNLTLNNGIVDSINGKIDKFNINTWYSTSDAKLSFDADLSQGISDQYELDGAVSGEISLGTVNILADGNAAGFQLFGGYSGQAPTINSGTAYTSNNKYSLSQSADNVGFIDVVTEAVSNGLNIAVTDDNGDKSFSALGETKVNADLGVMGGDSLTIHGNQNGIDGQNNKGLEVGVGKKLDVNHVGSTDSDGNLQSSFTGFLSEVGGAINNSGTLTVSNSIFSGNESTVSGGAIHNTGEAVIKNTSFINNKSGDKGGAITNIGGKVTIDAADGNIIFDGNTANGIANDIHVERGVARAAIDGEVILTGGYNTILNGGVSGNGTLTKTGTGEVMLGGDNSNFDGTLNLTEGTISLMKDATYLSASTTVFGDALLSLINGQMNNVNLGALTLNGSSKIGVDVDLEKKTGDFISADSVAGTGKLVIENINIIADSTAKETSVNIIDTANNLAQNTELSASATQALGPIYVYDVLFDNATGALNFSGGGSNGYNPAVLAGGVAAQSGTYLSQLKAYEAALENISAYAALPEEKDRAFWFKPYGDFEDVVLDNGPVVDVTSYGGLLGVDTYSREMLFGLNGFYSAYAGYAGSIQKYDGVETDQNGGLLGFGLTMYGSNFFTALTVNGGYFDNRTDTMYGKENFSAYSVGAALKTGYNIELPFYFSVIQPSVLVSYTFVDSENYTNAANVRIEGDTINAFQVAPGLKLIGNEIFGIQPSLEGRMVWSEFNDSNFKADSVVLPSLSIDPYAEYGLNLQKNWKTVSAYASIMGRSCGIKGISTRLGIKVSM